MIKEIILSMTISITPDVILHKNILPIVNDLSNIYNGHIHITSNFRPLKRNIKQGGIENSLHLCGKAIDIRIRGLSKQNVLDISKLKEYNVIVENNHIHIEYKEGC